MRSTRPERAGTYSADRGEVARLIGVLWLAGAVAATVLAHAQHGLDAQVLLPALLTACGGAVLAAGRVDATTDRVLDGLLLATTTGAALAAYGLPGGRQSFLVAVTWALPLAASVFPLHRTLAHAAYAGLLSAAVLAGGNDGPLRSGPAVDGIRWGLVGVAVALVGVLVHHLASCLVRRVTVAEAVAELGRRAMGAADTDELLREALRLATRMLGAEYGTALRRLPDGQLLVADELGPEPLERGHLLPIAPTRSYAMTVVDSGQPFVSVDLRRDPRITPPESLLSRGVVSGLAVPVWGADQVLGVLAMHSRRRRRFSPDEVDSALALANVVSTAWQQTAHRAQLSHQAMHDALTGLPNRALFLDRLEQSLSRRPAGRAADDVRHTAVMLLDLDDFKAVNDRLGHAAGDELLRGAARRFAGQLRPEDTIARLGGDEFAVLLHDVPDETTAATLAGRLQTALLEPLCIESSTVAVTASMGLTLAGREQPPSRSADVLLREADAALYAAKAEGRGHLGIFDEELRRSTGRRRQIETELRSGLENDEFTLHYQPVRDPVDRRVLGVEALLRWNHPTRGLVAPADFVPIAEDSGLIVSLGRWVLRRAVEQATAWQQEQKPGTPRLFMAVNLSPRQLDDAQLFPLVSELVENSGLAPGSLELELTETALLDGGVAHLQALTALRGAGARLVLDDFGTGYSSLTHLTQLPIDAVKIDRSFVSKLPSVGRDSAIVSAVIGLGADVGLQVIAEGVETEDQLLALRRMDCRAVQGFLLDRPQPVPSLGPTEEQIDLDRRLAGRLRREA